MAALYDGRDDTPLMTRQATQPASPATTDDTTPAPSIPSDPIYIGKNQGGQATPPAGTATVGGTTTPKYKGIRGAWQYMKDSWKETTAGMRQQQQDEQAETGRLADTDAPIEGDTSEVDLFQYFNKQPSKEELAREQRRLQREEQWAGIKDALNALSEMNTSQNHQYVPRTTLSDKARARREAITAQRQKERNNYYQGYMQARAADAQRLLQRRQEERQKVLEQQADEKYQAELAKTQAEAEYNKAKAEAARRGKTTTSKSSKPYTTMVMDGKEVSFQDQSEYERYVRDKASEYGISDTVNDGNVFNPHTRKKTINEIAAEVQAENRKRTSKSSPSAQGGNSGGGNNADANGEDYDEF